MTFREALLEGRAQLAVSDPDGAALDARILLAAASERDLAALISAGADPLPSLAADRYRSYLRRRLSGEPVARILGAAEFWGLRFALNAATLIPRPDTETLVEAALEVARSRFTPELRFCDLGTGSGAVAIALLHELQHARAVATDVSELALEAARFNATRLDVEDRVRFERVSFTEGPDGPFDLVVSNPPYIERDRIGGLQVEVRDHDPRLALDGGIDGLDAYRAILGRVDRLIDESGVVALEVGAGQADAVASLCRGAGLLEVAFAVDLAGRKRVVIACRRKSGEGRKTAKKALGKVG